MRRRKTDLHDDLRIVPDDGDDIAFLGGKDHLPLFCVLTTSLTGIKTVFFTLLSRLFCQAASGR
jgi:hypothetical protein